MNAAPPIDPHAVSLAVARHAHAATNARELQRVLVQDSQLLAPCDHCALVLHDGDSARVAAVSHQRATSEAAAGDAARQLAALAGRHRDALVVARDGPVTGFSETVAERAQRALRAAELRCAVVLPILHRDDQIGSLLLLYSDTPTPDAAALQPLAAVLPLLGAALAAHRRSGDHAATSRPRRRRWLALGIVAAVLALPVPFRVGGHAEVTATRAHDVYTELTGTVAEVLCEQGDHVSEGEVVARLDAEDLEFEVRTKQQQLTQLEAEVEILRNAAATDPTRTADFQLARLQQERAAIELEHLRGLRDKLVLRAPVTGVVTTGNVTGLRGRRFAAGETFCSVLPTESLELSLLVPEHDYGHVIGAEELTVVFAAEPTRSRTLAITRTDEIATATPEHGNTFTIHAALGDARTSLRAGMTGTGYVSSSWRPLGYVLFRRPLARLRELLLFW